MARERFIYRVFSVPYPGEVLYQGEVMYQGEVIEQDTGHRVWAVQFSTEGDATQGALEWIAATNADPDSEERSWESCKSHCERAEEA